MLWSSLTARGKSQIQRTSSIHAATRFDRFLFDPKVRGNLGIEFDGRDGMTAETTPAVARAVEIAGAIAGAARSPAIEPRHLLAGLTADAEATAAVWLSEHGLDVGGWRSMQPEVDGAHERRPEVGLSET